MNAEPAEEKLAVEVTSVQVNLFVDDIDAAVAFYGALGCPVVFVAPADGPAEHIEVEAAGTRIGLTSAAAANRLADLGVVPAADVSSELVFWCHDVDRMYGAALAAEATQVTRPTDSPDGRIRYGWVRDPGGNQLKFVAPRQS